jgi:hypothetical protein
MGLLLGGCLPHIPPHDTHVPPRLVDVRPPRSVLGFSTTVPLGGLDAALAAAVPDAISGHAESQLGRLGVLKAHWSFQRKAAQLGADERGLRLTLTSIGTLAIDAAHLSCRGEDVGLSFEAHGRPTLDPHGTLHLEDVKVDVSPAGTLACGALPVEPLLTAIAGPFRRLLEGVLALPRVPLGPLVELTLDALSRPLPIAPLEEKTGEPSCLDLDAQALVLSKAQAIGDEALALAIGLDVAPRLTIGACPERLSVVRAVRVRQAPAEREYRVLLALAIPYELLAEKLRDKAVGKRLGEGKRSIVVRSVELADANGRVLIKAQVEGAVTGTVALWGTPEVTERDGRAVLTVPDLQVAVETRSWLVRFGLGAWKLWNGGLQAKLRNAIELDLTDRLEKLRRMLDGERVIEAGGRSARLISHLSRVFPAEVASRPGVLVVHALLVGSAELVAR